MSVFLHSLFLCLCFTNLFRVRVHIYAHTNEISILYIIIIVVTYFLIYYSSFCISVLCYFVTLYPYGKSKRKRITMYIYLLFANDGKSITIYISIASYKAFMCTKNTRNYVKVIFAFFLTSYCFSILPQKDVLRRFWGVM